MKNIFACCLIFFILAGLTAGCGGGGGVGDASSARSLSVNIDTGRYIPPDVVQYRVFVLATSTGQAVASSTINVPDTSVTITDVPKGQVNVAAFAVNALGIVGAYGTGSVNIVEGATTTLNISLVEGTGYWVVLGPSVTADPYGRSFPYESRTVSAAFLYPAAMSGVKCTVSNIHGADTAMYDSGPGGAWTVMQYSFADQPHVGWVNLIGRGTGSYFENTLIRDSGQETGNYSFAINGLGALPVNTTVPYNYNYPGIPQITSPLPSADVDFDNDLTINWVDLGPGYGYLVIAKAAYSGSAGLPVYSYLWSNVDLRQLDVNDPRSYISLYAGLPEETSATIPGGTFPAGYPNVNISVIAVPKDQLSYNSSGAAESIEDPGKSRYSMLHIWNAVIPTATFTIAVNPYGEAPRIASISPSTFSAGQEVSILGSGFGSSQGTGRVYFGNLDAGTASVWHDTFIMVQAPQNVESGYLKVETSTGGVSNPYPYNVQIAYLLDRLMASVRLNIYHINSIYKKWAS
ncbi:MAG: IPT/TIG domain-containing protein [Chloroflexi bacterium]|nr:IPT/TIG domain-containing protein [Chloroflexota bacterium]